jgi:hypothetical protein
LQKNFLGFELRYIIIISSSFLGTGVSTQGFELARQAFYHLSHTFSHFALVILEIGSLFLPRSAWTSILPTSASYVARMTGMYYSIYLLVEMGSYKLLPGLAFNSDPPNLSLPTILN